MFVQPVRGHIIGHFFALSSTYRPYSTNRPMQITISHCLEMLRSLVRTPSKMSISDRENNFHSGLRTALSKLFLAFCCSGVIFDHMLHQKRKKTEHKDVFPMQRSTSISALLLRHHALLLRHHTLLLRHHTLLLRHNLFVTRIDIHTLTRLKSVVWVMFSSDH